MGVNGSKRNAESVLPLRMHPAQLKKTIRAIESGRVRSEVLPEVWSAASVASRAIAKTNRALANNGAMRDAIPRVGPDVINLISRLCKVSTVGYKPAARARRRR